MFYYSVQGTLVGLCGNLLHSLARCSHWPAGWVCGLLAAYSPPRLIAQPAREIVYKHGHRLVLPCHAVGAPQPTYVSPPLSTYFVCVGLFLPRYAL